MKNSFSVVVYSYFVNCKGYTWWFKTNIFLKTFVLIYYHKRGTKRSSLKPKNCFTFTKQAWSCDTHFGHVVSGRQAPFATKKLTLFITHENFPVNKETYRSLINLAKVSSPRLWTLVRCVLLWNILQFFNLGCVITGRGWKSQRRARKTLGLIPLLALRVRQSSAEYWAWLEWTSYPSLQNKADVKTADIFHLKTSFRSHM